MTFSEIRTNVLRRLGEASGATFYTTAEINFWINQGQLDFCLLQVANFIRRKTTTGLLEKTATVATTGGDFRLYPYTLMTDFLWPTRVAFGGKALLRTTQKDLARWDQDWQGVAGDPQHWGIQGLNLMFIHPRPAAPANLDVTFAYVPPTLTADGDIPAIGLEFHHLLEHYGAYLALMKEGVARNERSIAYSLEYLEGVGVRADLEPLPRRKG